VTPRTTPEQRAAANELLAAVAARIGETVSDGCLDIDGECVAGVSPFSGRVFVSGVAGLDRGKVIEAMPAASRTPNGLPSQVWEVVALIAERMAERIRREPEMGRLAAKAGPSRAPGETHYSDGAPVDGNCQSRVGSEVCGYKCALPAGHPGLHTDEGRFTLWPDAADTRTTFTVDGAPGETHYSDGKEVRHA
jgi:hypothetical protein